MNSLRHPIREPAPPGPPVLAWLVMLCAGAFVLRLFAAPVPPGQPPPGALSLAALESGEWWAVLTHIFTHADVWHLVSNMVLLVLAGRAVERNAGPRHLFYIFLASAWAGAALCLILRPEQAIIGASGAVWGIIGAFAALHPEYDLMRPLRRMVPLPPLKAKRLFPAFLIVHCGLEIAVRSAPGFAWMGVERVAHLVHAGGLLAGWLYGRRLASDASRHDEWTDFFPQGLRRRLREKHAGALPVAAGLPARENDRENENSPPPPRELSDSEFLREQVDPVLEKLYASGADQLTPGEKAVLEEASLRFSRAKK